MATGKDQPTELLIMALVRAKMCESIGKIIGTPASEKYFTLGLLSVLEALYEASMETILQHLPLPDDITGALTNGTGEMGSVLGCVKAYESGDWMELKCLQLEPAVIRDLYIESIDWANTFSPLVE